MYITNIRIQQDQTKSQSFLISLFKTVKQTVSRKFYNMQFKYVIR